MIAAKRAKDACGSCACCGTDAPAAESAPEEQLRVRLLSDAARAPVRGSPDAAGVDVFASQAAVVPARGRALVQTDIALAVPRGHYARVAPRSGLAVKHGIDVGAGVVDADYRGPLGIVLFNFGDADFAVSPGDRIAQLILERISILPVAVVDALEDTERGAGGFGSTGK